MIPYQTPILTGDTYEALLELDPLIDVKRNEHGYDWAGIIRFSVLVQKAGKVNSLKVKEVQDLMERLDGMKVQALQTALEKIVEASE